RKHTIPPPAIESDEEIATLNGLLPLHDLRRSTSCGYCSTRTGSSDPRLASWGSPAGRSPAASGSAACGPSRRKSRGRWAPRRTLVTSSSIRPRRDEANEADGTGHRPAGARASRGRNEDRGAAAAYLRPHRAPHRQRG